MKTHTTKNAEHGLVGNVETSEANNTETAKLFNCWLWPDHAISRAESRRMRDEHNALVNSHYELLEACKAIIKRWVGDKPQEWAEKYRNHPDVDTLLLSIVDLITAHAKQ